MQKPYVLLQSAMTIDGYIDDGSGTRLLLSPPEDFDRVDAVRAGVDAILVGASTIRRDNPHLIICSKKRQEERIARGASSHPIKVTLTHSAHLNLESNFFQFSIK